MSGKKASDAAIQPYQQAFAIWMLVSLLNFWTAFPIEWLFFLYFTLTIFLQAHDLGLAVFTILLAIILLTDIVIYAFFSYAVTTYAASFIVHTFLVYGMHGFGLSFDSSNVRGWILVTAMIILRFTVWNPWHGLQTPPSFMSPVAAHCTGFGTCYMLWKLVFVCYKKFDSIAWFFGIVVPDVPVVVVREVGKDWIKVFWTCEKAVGCEVKGFLVEVNGVVIGEVGKDDMCVVVGQLVEDTRYRIRVWALAGRRIKTPSKCVLVKTLKPHIPPGASHTHEGSTKSIEASAEAQEQFAAGLAAMSEFKRLGEAIAGVLTDLNNVRRARTDVEKLIQDAETQHAREEAELREELGRLREAKKAGEAPRAELKAKIKQLEEAKRECDSLKMKLEKEVKRESGSRKHALEELEDRKKEIGLLETELETVEENARQAEEAYEKRKAEMERAISVKTRELADIRRQIEARSPEVEEMKARIAVWEKEIIELESDARRIRLGAHVADGAENRGIGIEKEHERLFKTFVGLQEDYRRLQAELREETRSRMELLQRLTVAKRGKESVGSDYARLRADSTLGAVSTLGAGIGMGSSGSLGGTLPGGGTSIWATHSGPFHLPVSQPPPGFASFSGLENGLMGLGGTGLSSGMSSGDSHGKGHHFGVSRAGLSGDGASSTTADLAPSLAARVGGISSAPSTILAPSHLSLFQQEPVTSMGSGIEAVAAVPTSNGDIFAFRGKGLHRSSDSALKRRAGSGGAGWDVGTVKGTGADTLEDEVVSRTSGIVGFGSVLDDAWSDTK
ncbi:hypothetical protein HK104_006785 [Borealophlyctis nickersoniae]|nr:hypothetical protein HK104_006785 [Borealophlyctis nickersoniae]